MRVGPRARDRRSARRLALGRTPPRAGGGRPARRRPGRTPRPLLDDSATGTGDADVSTGRFRLHLAVGDYLTGIAETAPLLLVLDDLHWADEETLALLARLAGRLRDRPVLLLATFRRTEVPDGLAAALAALARHEPARIDLGGLSAPEVAALVRGTGVTGFGDAELAVIAERTGGNPFFTRETARLLDAEGCPPPPGGSPPVSGTCCAAASRACRDRSRPSCGTPPSSAGTPTCASWPTWPGTRTR